MTRQSAYAAGVLAGVVGVMLLGGTSACHRAAEPASARPDAGAAADGAAPETAEASAGEPGPETGAGADRPVEPEVGADAVAGADRQVEPEAGTDAGDARGEARRDGGAYRDTGQPVYHGIPQPMCVWNEAYQENYAADTVAEILAGARNCYVLIDPFADAEARNAIAQMKQDGNLVSCYISVGTCEDWRDDFAAMKPYCVSKQWGEWPGEYFVDRTDAGLVDLMKARIDKMTAWGCNMVEFDNMDWTFDPAYRSQYAISATSSQGEAYNRSLCAYVHANGLGCMAKSSAQGASDFDGLTVESAPGNLDWWEAGDLSGMLAGGRIGIVVHYDERDCAGVRSNYQAEYGAKLSFICEDKALKKYRHFP